MSSVAKGFKALADMLVFDLNGCVPLRLNEGELNLATGEVERLEDTRRVKPSIAGEMSMLPFSLSPEEIILGTG